MSGFKKIILRGLPEELTSYDLLKSFALITMIIDHIGYYFFPDQIEWRIIGRMSMPAWMFLIGYAQTRDIQFIALGAIFLVLSNLVLGLYVFPLNILFTIIFIRLLIDFIGFFIKKGAFCLFLTLVVFSVIITPTYHYFEYGSAAFLFAVLGYVVRHQMTLGFSSYIIWATAGFAVIPNLIIQKITKSLDNIDTILMTVAMFAISYVLINFKSKIYSELTKILPKLFVLFLQFMGRRTLAIYIVQMLFFKIGRIVINSY